MFTASGLRIRFLKVYEKSGYKPTKLHKTMTKAGDYQHRLWLCMGIRYFQRMIQLFYTKFFVLIILSTRFNSLKKYMLK